MKREYKAVITRGGTKYETFMVYNESFGEWFECDTPQLFPKTSSIKGLKKLMPEVDFEGMEMVDVTIEMS